MPDPGEITALLRRFASGDSAAENELLSHVYTELRRIASWHIRKESVSNTLQATALVHEAYLRLSQSPASNIENRAHFFAIASRVMRRVLIENARNRGCIKRGAAATHISLDESVKVGADSDQIVIAVHEALERLELLSSRQAKIVEMRFFAGLQIEEIAEVLQLSVRTIHRDWNFARAWLHGELR